MGTFLGTAAGVFDTLRVPLGNQLEALLVARKGPYSIRVNRQWRICFRWKAGNAHDVEIVDHYRRRRGLANGVAHMRIARKEPKRHGIAFRSSNESNASLTPLPSQMSDASRTWATVANTSAGSARSR